MGGLDGFAFTFLNLKVMATWLPKIAEGFVLTVLLAALIVAAGLALGLGLAVLRAFGLRVLNWGIVFVDITLDAATGEIVCHEVNGANAVGSDALTGDSVLRAENEAQQAVRRARELGYLAADGSFSRQVVTLHGHQHWQFFRTGGEFYPRVASFADCLAEKLPGTAIGVHAANKAPR